MDLLGCPRCNERFVLRDAGTGEGWACHDCRAELRLVAREVPRWVAPLQFNPHHLNRVSHPVAERFLRPG